MAEPSDLSDTARGDGVLHVAVVHTKDEICHLTASTCEHELAGQLAAYVREHLTYQLWPADADHVRKLLGEGRTQEAVSTYFARVGKWDPERLVVRQLRVAAATPRARHGDEAQHRSETTTWRYRKLACDRESGQ